MTDLHFPGSDRFLLNIFKHDKPLSLQFGNVFETTVNFIEMALQLFIVTTIRCYEQIIITEPEDYRGKVKYLKKLLKERFKAPSLGTLLDLSRNCFYLVNEKDNTAPDGLLTMKNCLDKSMALGPIATLLNDLELLFENGKQRKGTKAKTIYKEQSKLHLHSKLLPKFVEYRNRVKHSRDISLILDDHIDTLGFNIETWHEGFRSLMIELNPIISNTYQYRTLGTLDKSYGGPIEESKKNLFFIIDITAYKEGKKELSKDKLSFEKYEEMDDYQSHTISELLISDKDKEIPIDLFPFLTIEDDKLYFYKITRAIGYEYYSLCDNTTHLVPTKRKFNHSLFKIGTAGDKQALFWTEVPPTTNPISNIKANIPTEGLVDFVGRKKQIRRILEEIVQIPNQHGLLYGPGGVGKTALLLELTAEMFQEENKEEILFNNIIWVSSKTNYYNPFLNVIEEKPKQFDSLDNIFSVILRFFEYGDVEEYDFEDKLGLIIELLDQNRVLLVLDNFETVPPNEKEKIIKFFGVEAKKHLREKPDYFKVIITSRVQIPSGYHQIKLEGLDLRESKQLMENLFWRYKGTKQDFSNEQKERIHEVTCGIPIIIKHCCGQIFEFNKPLDHVIKGLSDAANRVITFSFEEILKILKKDDCQLRIILLLELINHPLLIRQIAGILEIDEEEIRKKIPNLINFQCLERINELIDEKYFISENVRLFTKGLVQDNPEVAKVIRKKIIQNFSLEKQMDYTTEEEDIIGMFNRDLEQKNYLEAEEFIKDQCKKKPESILLRYYYAKYLKYQKREVESAIDILEDLRKKDTKHPNILRLLISCHTSTDLPNFDKASIYATELENVASEDDDIKLELAEYYISWSNSIKVKPPLLDPIKEIERRARYKEIANKAISILKDVETEEKKTHKYFHLYAQGYFHIWDNENALIMINNAINAVGSDTNCRRSYRRFKKIIIKRIDRFLD